MHHRRLTAAVLAAALLWGALIVGSPVGAQVPGLPEDAPDELSAEEDNAADGHDTCGGEPVSETGSEVHRKLIDGPRQPDGSLAFTAGVCIYLPPGYRDGTRRYPVLYLLHGAFGWQDDWLVQGDAQAILDRASAADPANDLIVVMPDGNYGAVWRDEPGGDVQVESYVLDHVIPYVDRWFRTIDDRRGRAMSGLSNGGAGTLRMAAHQPDLFGVVTAMSAALPVNMAADRTDVHAVHNDPTELAENLGEVELALVYGLTCGTVEECQANAVGYAFENACCSNEAYRAKLELVRDRPYKYEATDGAHTWYFWQRWLEFTHGEYLRRFLADPTPVVAALPPLAPPTSFDHRSIDDVVAVYDHTFANDPHRATEFLTLTDVTRDGFTVRGSGTLAATTAARYTPGRTYAVAGTGLGEGAQDVVEVVADDEGRLAFDIGLGPAHTDEEGSPAALAAEAAAAGGYWVTRTVEVSAGRQVGGTPEHRSTSGDGDDSGD